MKLAVVFLVLLSFQLVKAHDAETPDLKSAAAASESSVVDQRQQRQENRIQQGVNSGSLSKKEERRIRKDQARIKRMEKHSKKDGHVTAKEKKKIHRAQKHASHKISRKKHNKH